MDENRKNIQYLAPGAEITDNVQRIIDYANNDIFFQKEVSFITDASLKDIHEINDIKNDIVANSLFPAKVYQLRRDSNYKDLEIYRNIKHHVDLVTEAKVSLYLSTDQDNKIRKATLTSILDKVKTSSFKKFLKKGDLHTFLWEDSTGSSKVLLLECSGKFFWADDFDIVEVEQLKDMKNLERVLVQLQKSDYAFLRETTISEWTQKILEHIKSLKQQADESESGKESSRSFSAC
eukprot:GHVP01035283.1.p1 GENE.GHVP01035283.1~~GHVP01035283.1.p1  ORF type:complete len:270 (+),score=38.64 GHVP01035283.1:108-812(+)